MTPEERQELREKHSVDLYALASRMTICVGCCMDYPCDVIRVLDATENLNPTDLKTEVECDHNIGYRLSPENARVIRLADYLEPSEPFVYCPKCGEKL